MPIFVKKAPKARESRLKSVPTLTEDVSDFNSVSLKLGGDKTLKFVEGNWTISDANSSTQQSFDKLKNMRSNQKLMEENNMLNAKMDILLDLLTECVDAKERE